MAKAKKASKKTVKKSAAKKTTRPAAKKAAVKKAPAKKMTTGIIADVEHLMQMMAANDVTEIDIADGNKKISLKRGCGFVAAAPVAPVAAAAPVTAPAPVADAPAAPAVDDDLLTIESPMVGTFYAAPSPDADPYVKVGDTITPDTVVCIVEAMKVMNEIKAEVSGTIKEICVKNAQGVEFGQVMFKIKP